MVRDSTIKSDMTYKDGFIINHNAFMCAETVLGVLEHLWFQGTCLFDKADGLLVLHVLNFRDLCFQRRKIKHS
mgnify:FL=1